MLPVPFQTTALPGVNQFAIKGTGAGASASPHVLTLQLPEQGAFLFTAMFWEWGRNNMAAVVGTAIWDAPASFAPTTFVRKTSLIGAPGFATPEVTGLTASDPDAAGVITFTLTDTRGASTGVGLGATLYQLATATHFSSL